jgi:hypothetical protein
MHLRSQMQRLAPLMMMIKRAAINHLCAGPICACGRSPLHGALHGVAAAAPILLSMCVYCPCGSKPLHNSPSCAGAAHLVMTASMGRRYANRLAFMHRV